MWVTGPLASLCPQTGKSTTVPVRSSAPDSGSRRGCGDMPNYHGAEFSGPRCHTYPEQPPLSSGYPCSQWRCCRRTAQGWGGRTGAGTGAKRREGPLLGSTSHTRLPSFHSTHTQVFQYLFVIYFSFLRCKTCKFDFILTCGQLVTFKVFPFLELNVV